MADAAQPTGLRVEYERPPANVETARPRFGWRLPDGMDEQTAYHLLVATEREVLIENDTNFWDSGIVESENSTLVTYDGPDLSHGERYYWQVRVRDCKGVVSAWSEPAVFETTPQPDEWEAEWIGPEALDTTHPAPAPAFRTEFDLQDTPERARLYVSGVGCYEPHLNESRLGERVLDPAPTDYEERIHYSIYDVTDGLHSGTNALAFVLGRGRYALTTENTWRWHDPPWHSDVPHLRACLEIRFADGSTRTVATDEDWCVAASPTRFDSIYAGEVYDARERLGAWRSPDYDDEEWVSATTVDGPTGELHLQRVQPMRVTDETVPERIDEPEPNVYVFDFGVMTTGWVELTVDGPAGTEIELTYGEKRHGDGTVDIDQDFVAADIQTDMYILAGDGEECWEPRFSYKGFRYVEVRGWPGEPTTDALAAKTVNTAIDEGAGGRFECSDKLLNRVHRNTQRALLNNHQGIPTDTPVYEKNGWTGDAQLTAQAAIYNFDMARFYAKWLADFADAQRASGELPPIVPTSDWGYSDGEDDAIEAPLPGWDAAYILVPWWCYRHYGDQRLLARHYEGMKRYVKYLADYADDGVVGCGLGDWLAPGHGEIRTRPPEGPVITSTAYYYRMAEVVAEIAGVLDFPADREEFSLLAEHIRTAFNEHFFDPDTGTYATGETDEYRQTSNVFPLAFDIVPDEHRRTVVENLVADVVEAHDGHLNTGILGTKYLLPVLTEAGHLDVAFEVATQRSYPSWGHWVADGATSLYEAWELESRSRNHHMFGSIDEWFYRYLAGIKPAEPGYKRVVIEPHVPDHLDTAEATVETIRGPVTVSWEDRDDTFSLDVTVPSNADTTVSLPVSTAATVTVDGAPPAEVAAVTPQGRNIFRIEPGDHSFIARWER